MMSSRRLRARQVAREQREQSGFTLIEVVVAMAVVAVGLLGLMAVQARSIGSVTLAGQRQAASQLANRAMEQMRALPYGTLIGGVVCSDLTGDTNLVVTAAAGGGCTATFRPAYDTRISESVVTQTGSQSPPVNPHRQPTSSTTVGGTTYDVRAYVTRVNPNATVDAGLWLTVTSTWTSSASRNAPVSLATRSQVSSPTGCAANTTHPYSGPCAAFLSADAGVTGGGLVVTSTRANQPVLDGLDAARAQGSPSAMSARVQTDQVVAAQAQAVTSGATVTPTSGAARTSGGAAGSSVADTDPATGSARSPGSPTAVGPTGAGPVTSVGASNALTLTPDGAGTGSALGTAAAGAIPACTDENGSTIANGQACSSARATPAASVSSTLIVAALGADRPLALADVAQPGTSTPSRAFSGRFLTGSASHCPTAAGVGCIAAGVRRTLGTARAGGLAALQTADRVQSGGADRTVAFGSTARSLVTVTDYTDLAQAEGGVGAQNLTPTRAGSLSYWNGAAFTTVTLSAGTAATYTVPATTATYGTTTVAVAGTVTVTAATPGTLPTGCTSAAACVTRVTGGNVLAALSYTITTGGSVVGQFSVTLDLGTASAQAGYQAAPGA